MVLEDGSDRRATGEGNRWPVYARQCSTPNQAMMTVMLGMITIVMMVVVGGSDDNVGNVKTDKADDKMVLPPERATDGLCMLDNAQRPIKL